MTPARWIYGTAATLRVRAAAVQSFDREAGSFTDDELAFIHRYTVEMLRRR